MAQNATQRIPKLDYAVLPLVLGLAFFITFIPHQTYPYPVHIDEWVHLSFSEAILKAGSATFSDPFYGETTIGFTSGFETGFQLFWAVFHQVSGIAWPTIFRYFPSIIFMMTVLSSYALGRRLGFGWEAALFTCFIPTTVGILGPAFLVPIAMSLLFISLAILVAYHFRTIWSYLLLFLLTTTLLTIHAVSAIAPAIVLIPYLLLNLKGNFKHSLGVALAVGIPLVAPFIWISDALLPFLRSLFVASSGPAPWVDLPKIISTYGYLPVAFGLLGALVLAIRGERRNYGLVLGLLVLLVILAAFYRFHYGIYIMYYRGLMWMMLMMSIVAGAGLAWVRSLRLTGKLATWLKPAWFAHNVGNILGVILIGLMLTIAIPDRQRTPYYHMIDTEDYETFIWIRDNVGGDYPRAILDPWKATAFTAITGKNVYTRIHSFPRENDKKAYAFLDGGATDTSFLTANGISLVYTRQGSNNPDLTEVRQNVFLVKKR